MRDCACSVLSGSTALSARRRFPPQRTFHCECVAESWRCNQRRNLSASNCISRCLQRLLHSGILSGVNVDPDSRLPLPDLFYTYLPALSQYMQASWSHLFNPQDTQRSANPRSFVLFVTALASDAMEWLGCSRSPAVELRAADFAASVRDSRGNRHETLNPDLHRPPVLIPFALTSFPVSGR